jgi:hypothetical protein
MREVRHANQKKLAPRDLVAFRACAYPALAFLGASIMSKFFTIAASAAMIAACGAMLVAATSSDTKAQNQLVPKPALNMSLIHEIACTEARKKACQDHCGGSTTSNCAPCAACK